MLTSPRAFLSNLVFQLRICGSSVNICRVRRQRDLSVELICGDEIRLSPIPGFEDLRRWGAPKNARVNEASELHVRDVPRSTENPLEIPDCFRR